MVPVCMLLVISPPISGVALETVITDYRTVMTTMNRLKARYPMAVLQQCLALPALSVDALEDQADLGAWAEQLQGQLNELVKEEAGYEVTVVEDEEHHRFMVTVAVTSHSITTLYKIDQEFFASKEYGQFVAFAQVIDGLVTSASIVKRGDGEAQVTTMEAAVSWLLSEAKRGQSVQRYKGLGEMNPEQLWETTMDPSVRRLLQVTIEDAVAADQIFTTLMGDQVDPRREFIEENALKVENLDV